MQETLRVVLDPSPQAESCGTPCGTLIFTIPAAAIRHLFASYSQYVNRHRRPTFARLLFNLLSPLTLSSFLNLEFIISALSIK
jgi:hypothetical protein